MTPVTLPPLLAFPLAFLAMTLAAWLGVFLRRQRPVQAEVRDDFGIILAATLTLLGLVIGFSFSMALSRYDQRKNYEEAEANAIGTAYVRADLLPAADAAAIRAPLLRYLEQRLLFYTTRDEHQLRQIEVHTEKLQAEMWSAVRAPALAAPTPVAALVVAGMNDVLNAQGYTQAAWWNRIPLGAWFLMMAIALAANVLLGLGARSTKAASLLFLVLPLIVAIALFLIADIDSPRRGLIRVVPQNLLSLSQSLRSP
jgi:hypothetical protein